MTTPIEPPLTPIPGSNFSPTSPKSTAKKNKTLLIALVIVGIIAVVFFITTIIFSMQSSNKSQQLTTATQDGAKAGAEAQKAADDKKFEEAQSSDTRTYTAPAYAGSFSIKLPKLWSLSITPNESTTTISAIANPENIDTKAERYALRFSLINQTYTNYKTKLDQQTKQKVSPSFKGLTSSKATLSGIEGTKYVGQISTKITNGTVILVPIRDKTYSIETDDNAVFSEVFNTIIASVVLNP